MTKLQYLRKEKNISQFELAKRADISIQAVQKYEQGIYPIEGVRLAALLRICDVLGCKIWELIEDEKIAGDLRMQFNAPLVQNAEH